MERCIGHSANAQKFATLGLSSARDGCNTSVHTSETGQDKSAKFLSGTVSKEAHFY